MRSALESVTGERPKLLRLILKSTQRMALVSYVAAVWYIYVSIGGLGPWAEHTRISEHALMPGLVTERFDMDGRLSEYLKGLKQVHDEKGSYQDFICTGLHDAGVSCYEQNWHTTVAIQNSTGRNVYGVVRAHRATGVESMLIAVDMQHREAVAVVMAYAAFAREQVYWARDLFFVFVDGGALGMDSFLSQYHRVPAAGVEGDALRATGGLLIGGVVFKSQPRKSTKPPQSTIELQLNHVNGQLPNLDLFNSIVRIAGRGKFGLKSVIYGVGDVKQSEIDPALLVPLRALYTQAFVAAEGSHSVMGKYGVQGLSVSLPSSSTYRLAQSVRLVEAVARSMNNVLERFHQSYFLYILTSEDNFLSIAYYMPMMAVLLPLLMFAYREWVEMSSFSVPPAWMLLHLPGLATWLVSSHYFSTHSISPSTNDVIYLLAALAMPFGLFSLPMTPSSQLPSLRFLVYLEAALLAMAVSQLNFGLGLISSLMAVPLIVRLTGSNTNRLRQLVRTAVSLACHPLCLHLAFLAYAYPLLAYKATADVGIDTIPASLVRLLRDHLLFGSWLLPLLCCCAIPLWNCCIILAAGQHDEIVMPKLKEE